MDDMVQLHADYVDRIVDRCLLGDKVRDDYFSWRPMYMYFIDMNASCYRHDPSMLPS